MTLRQLRRTNSPPSSPLPNSGAVHDHARVPASTDPNYALSNHLLNLVTLQTADQYPGTLYPFQSLDCLRNATWCAPTSAYHRPPLTHPGSLVPSSGGTGSNYTTTPPTVHKRKASEADFTLSPSEEPRKKALKTPEPPVIDDLPATPVTNASGTMDSDDDFNSSMSGEDFEDQDSDLGIEDGRCMLDRRWGFHANEPS